MMRRYPDSGCGRIGGIARVRLDVTRGSVKSVRAPAIVILVGIGVAFMGVPTHAQQPTAVSTARVPNPNWCPGVPLSARPPQVEADVWVSVWQRCANLPGAAEDYTCGHYCKGAREMQWRARMHAEAPTAEQSPEWPAPTDKQQGPFRLKNGGWKFIAPLASPAPKPAPESAAWSRPISGMNCSALRRPQSSATKYPMNHTTIASDLSNSFSSPLRHSEKQNLTERNYP